MSILIFIKLINDLFVDRLLPTSSIQLPSSSEGEGEILLTIPNGCKRLIDVQQSIWSLQAGQWEQVPFSTPPMGLSVLWHDKQKVTDTVFK